MRKLVIVVLLGVFIPQILNAQEVRVPKLEFYGGYSLLHSPVNGTTFHGWETALTTNVTRSFGITTDFSGHYFNYSQTSVVNDVTHTLHQSGSLHDFLIGPRICLRRERLVPFTHVLVGVSEGLQDNSLSTATATSNTVRFSDNVFTAAVGGGLDVSLTSNLALRPVQLEYYLNRVHGFTTNRFRYSGGIVINFGKKSTT